MNAATSIPDATGTLVAPGTDQDVVDGFVSAVKAFDPSEFSPTKIRQWAENFSRENFRARMQQVMDDVVA